MKVRSLQILATTIAALLATPAFAITDTWDGGGADNNIGTNNNWADNTAPVNDLANTDVIFAGNLRLTPNFGAQLIANSIVFNNTAGAFVFGGSSLTIGVGGITNNDADTQTFNNIVSVGTASTFNAASGALAFSALSLGTNALTFNTATGTSSIGVLQGTGTVTKTGAGTLTLSASPSVLGADLNLNAGITTLSATGSTQFVSSTSTITIGASGTLNLNEGMTLDGAQLTRASGGTLSLAAGKTLTVLNGGDAIITGIFNHASASTISVTGAGSTFTATGNFSVNGGATLGISAGGSASSSAASIFIGSTTNGTVTVDGAASTFNGTSLSVGQSGGTGSLTFSNGASGTFGSIGVDNSGAAGSNGTLQIESGSSVTGTSLLLAANNSANSGSITITGGGSVLTISGAGNTGIGATNASTGTLNVQNGGAFNSGTGATTISATGTVVIAGGTFNANGNMVVNGLITRDAAGSLTLDAGNTLTIQNGGDFTITGNFSHGNASTIAVIGTGSTLTNTGTLNVNGGGTINITSGGTMSSGSSAQNIGTSTNGTVTVDGTGSSLAGGIASLGSAGGTAILTFSNGATGAFAGINVDNSANAATSATLDIESGAKVTGSDLVLATSTAANDGTVTINGAGSALTITGAGITNIGATSLSSATLDVQNGGVFSSGTGTTTVNTTGTVAITGGTFNANGNMTLNGLMTSDATGRFNLANGRTLTIQNGGDFINSDTYVHTSASTVTVSGAGSSITSLASGSLRFSGGSTVNVLNGGQLVSGGTLFFAALFDPGNATVAVDGPGSSLSAPSATWGQNGNSANVTFSNGATGAFPSTFNLSAATTAGTNATVNVLSGSTLTAGNFNFGAVGPATTATLTVDGAGSSMTINGNGAGTIGVTGGGGTTAALNVRNGGVFNSSSGTMTVRQSGSIAISGGTYNVKGTLTIQGGQLTLNNAGTLNLNLGTSMNVQDGGDAIITSSFLQPVRANLTVSGPGSTFTTGGDFQWESDNNTLSIVNVNGGGLISSGGSFHLARNDTAVALTVNGVGSQIISSPFFTSEWNAGVLLINGASATLGALRLADFNFGSQVFGSLSVNSGASATLGNFNAASVTADNHAAISVDGTGSQITQTGASTLTLGALFLSAASLEVSNGGTFTSGTGTVTLNPTATIDINGGTLNLKGTIANSGATVNFNSGALSIINDFTVGPGGLIGDGDLTMTANKQFTTTGTTTIDSFRTLTLDGGTFRTGSLVNNGSLDFKKGTLGVTGAGGFNIGSGALGSIAVLGTGANLVVSNATTINSGATLRVDGGSFNTGSIVNDGSVRLDFGGFTTGGFANQSGATLFLSDSLTAGAVNNVAGGRITLRDGTGRIRGATGNLNNSGVLTGDGIVDKPLFNAGTGEVRAEAGKTLVFTNSVATNVGTFNLQGGTLDFTAGILTNNLNGYISGHGALNTTSLTNFGVMAFSGGNSNIRGDVTNAARIVTSGAGSTTTFFDDVTHNGAEIFTGAGASTVIFGSLLGAGPFTGTGTVYSIGDLRPGNSPATVSYGGSLVLGNGTLTMEIGGLTRGTQYDGLNIAGSFATDGALALVLFGGFSPALGDTFNLFDAASTTGAFDSLILPALAQYLAWETSDLYTTGIVEVTTTLTPIEQWRLLHFGAPENTGNGADANDFDKDGSVNLLEYALGMDPKVANVEGLPALGTINVAGSNHLTLTIKRPLTATDISYRFQAGGTLLPSNDGSLYTAGGDVPSNAFTSEVSRTNDGSIETIVVRDNAPMSSATARFMRLKVGNP